MATKKKTSRSCTFSKFSEHFSDPSKGHINTELCRFVFVCCLSSEVVLVRATHHSSQAVLLHQPEGVLVAGSEVIGLGGAHVTPGHRAHGVDDICHAGKQDRVPFQHG